MNKEVPKKVVPVPNPTKEVRHNLLKEGLSVLNREEDFDSLISLASPPQNIETILPKGSGKGIKVGVIGAGCAGLAAAYELRKLGYDITLIEGSKDRVGGRVFTHYYTPELYGELGAMRIPVSHEVVWHYINEFGLKTNPFFQETENSILYVKNRRIYGQDFDQKMMEFIYPLFDLTKYERNTPLSELVKFIYNYPIEQLKFPLRQSLVKIQKSYPFEINRIDYLNLRKACKELHLSEGAITLLSNVLGIDRNLFYHNYLELLREEYFASYYSVYEIKGGLSQLPLAMYNELKKPISGSKNIIFRHGCRVVQMADDQLNNKVNLTYMNTTTNKLEMDTFDYVICAIPFSTLRLVKVSPQFTNSKMQAIAEVNYSPSQKTIVLSDQRFWERTINGVKIIGGGSRTDMPINTIWYPSHQYGGKQGVITGSYNMNLDTTRIGNLEGPIGTYQLNRELEEIHNLPFGYLNQVLRQYKTMNWNTNDLSLGAFCVYYPEQNRLFSYVSKQPEYNNKVFFAGEHTSSFHAWMQGAFQSGMEAANMVAMQQKLND